VDHLAPARAVHGVGDAHLAQAAVQPGQVLRETERPPGIDGHHLVDAITEDEAAVEHADLGFADVADLAIEPAGQGRNRFAHGCIVTATPGLWTAARLNATTAPRRSPASPGPG